MKTLRTLPATPVPVAMTRLRRGFGAVLALAAVASALVASAPPAAAQEVTIGYQAVISPWNVAIVDGAFEDSTGYTIHWKRFDTAAGINDALGSGKVDILLRGSAGIAAMISYGLPYKLFWISEQIDAAEALVVRRDSGIAEPQDLRGKRIAVPAGSTTHFHLLFALEHFGIDVDEVSLEFQSPSEIVEAWASGDLDAAFVWYPALGTLLESGSVLLTSGQLAALGRPTFDGLAVRDEFADSNKGFMCQFVRTLAAADADYRNNPGSFAPGSPNAAKIARLAGTDESTVAGILALYEFLPLADQAGRDWLGRGAAETLKSTAQFLVDQRLVRRLAPSYAAGVTDEFVNGAIRGCPAWSGPATDVSQLMDPVWMRNASLSQVEVLLNLGADLSAVGGSLRRTPLHVAAGWNQNPAVTQLMLDRGADINVVDATGRTPLHLAARHNRNPAVAELLVARGASTDVTDERGWTVLRSALAGGNDRVEDLIRKRGAPPAEVAAWRLVYSDWAATATVESLARLLDFDNSILAGMGPRGSFLHRLAQLNPDPDVVGSLLDRGADIRTPRRYGETVLFAAAENGNPDVSALLLDRGANIHATNLFGETALHLAAARNENPAVVELLLDRGADPNAADHGSQTVLHSAVRNENPAVAALLIDRGADFSAQSFSGRNALLEAALAGCREIVELLLDRGADPNATDYGGSTALHWAARRTSPSPEIAELLLDRGADVAAVNAEGRTALNEAVRRAGQLGAAALVAVLLDRGANPGGIDPQFWPRGAGAWVVTESVHRVREWLGRIPEIDDQLLGSLLVTAAQNPDPEVTALLLDRGADPNAIGNLGGSALHWAAARENLEAARLLLDRGADISARDGRDSTPLHWAVVCPLNREFLALLVAAGADPNAVDDQGQTALHWAARWNGERAAEATRALVELGADPNALDRFGRTALHWAARRSSDPAVAGVLLDHVTALNATDRGGATPLTLAGLNPKWAVTQALLGRGLRESALEERLLDPEWLSNARPVELDAQVANASIRHLLQRDGCGRTPMHLMSHYAGRDIDHLVDFRDRYQTAAYRALLGRGDFVNIDTPDRNGNTALHYAVAGASKQPRPGRIRMGPPGLPVVGRLRGLGADTEAVGGGDLWPVHYSVSSGDFSGAGGGLTRYLSGSTDPRIDPLTWEPFPDARVPLDRYDPCIASLP